MFRTIAVYPQGGDHVAYIFTVYRMLQLRNNPNNIHSSNLLKASQCENVVVIVLCA